MPDFPALKISKSIKQYTVTHKIKTSEIECLCLFLHHTISRDKTQKNLLVCLQIWTVASLTYKQQKTCL